MSTPAPTAQGFPYAINDADEHSTLRKSVYEEYIDPSKRHLAVKEVRLDDGRVIDTYNGRAARFLPKSTHVTATDEVLSQIGVTGLGQDETGAFVPGSLLNRLNPLKGMTLEQRRAFVRHYRTLQAQLDNRDTRITIMDSQGIDRAVNFATLPGIEVEFEGDLEGLYANCMAMDRFIAEEWGFNFRERLFTPPFVSFADPELAFAQLEGILRLGTPRVIQISTGPAMNRSPFHPDNDRFWSVCSEVGIVVATHLASATRYAAHGEDWDEPEVMLWDMDAFQWTLYWGDRPAYETVAAAILQGWFSRFPKMKLLLSEQGTVWVPYIVRKMDHAVRMGRSATWGTLDKLPSEYFRAHCFVAPFPEENIDRVVDAVGVSPIVFGSDFPHGEGLADPSHYLGQVKNLAPSDVRAVMRDNLNRFLCF